jgi:hypothetical protein
MVNGYRYEEKKIPNFLTNLAITNPFFIISTIKGITWTE